MREGTQLATTDVHDTSQIAASEAPLAAFVSVPTVTPTSTLSPFTNGPKGDRRSRTRQSATNAHGSLGRRLLRRGPLSLGPAVNVSRSALTRDDRSSTLGPWATGGREHGSGALYRRRFTRPRVSDFRQRQGPESYRRPAFGCGREGWSQAPHELLQHEPGRSGGRQPKSLDWPRRPGPTPKSSGSIPRKD